MTVIASPGQGPDRSTEVSYTDTKVTVRSLLVPSFVRFVASSLFRSYFISCFFSYLFCSLRNCCSVFGCFVLLSSHLCVPLFVLSSVRLSFNFLFINSLIHLVLNSFNYFFIYSLTHSFSLKFIQFLIYSFTHYLSTIFSPFSH